MKQTLLIITALMLIVGFSSGQDLYPYFQDPVKQFEFESKKIYVKEVNENRMVVSGGGDTYQFFDSLIEGESVYRQEPINTSYNYIYKFEIMINGELINEVEFLQIVGLKNIADEILIKYQNELTVYENKLKKYNSRNNEYQGKTIYLSERLEYLGICGLIIMATAFEGVDSDVGLVAAAVGAGMTGVYFLTTLIPIGHEVLTHPPPRKPVLTQQLDNQQIVSISESYNRRIFEEIKDE